MHVRLLAVLTPVAVALIGCAHTLIEGTQIPDTPENREIMEVLGEMRGALQERDGERLLRLVSPRYFEDMGTADPRDDYGYHELSTDVLPSSFEATKEFHVTLQVHDVVVDGDAAHADVRYSSRARIELRTGSLWDSHKEFNRVELEREQGRWQIVSGL